MDLCALRYETSPVRRQELSLWKYLPFVSIVLGNFWPDCLLDYAYRFYRGPNVKL